MSGAWVVLTTVEGRFIDILSSPTRRNGTSISACRESSRAHRYRKCKEMHAAFYCQFLAVPACLLWVEPQLLPKLRPSRRGTHDEGPSPAGRPPPRTKALL